MSYFKAAVSLMAGIFAPAAVAMTLTSPDFRNNGSIPVQFTCHGDNVPPTLMWDNVPAGTQSFVLTMIDPDATNGTWVHWVLYNIPKNVSSVSKNKLPGVGGLTSWNKTTYGGPCPPSGVHHYIFKLYALNAMLTLPGPLTLDQLSQAMQPYIFGEVELTGVYPGS